MGRELASTAAEEARPTPKPPSSAAANWPAPPPNEARRWRKLGRKRPQELAETAAAGAAGRSARSELAEAVAVGNRPQRRRRNVVDDGVGVFHDVDGDAGLVGAERFQVSNCDRSSAAQHEIAGLAGQPAGDQLRRTATGAGTRPAGQCARNWSRYFRLRAEQLTTPP